jgi:RNA polymerase sigma-70 factor (ECF subfamily)
VKDVAPRVSKLAVVDAALADVTDRVSIDDALVERAARGDRMAFSSVVAGRIQRLYRLAYSILRSEADAADATQQTFVVAWQELPRLRDRDRFDAWLGRILVNVCRDELRRRNRRTIREVRVDTAAGGDMVGSLVGTDDVEALVGRADEIQRAFAMLNGDQRALLAMHHVDGQSIERIAATLGIPTGTAKWRLFAARRALERALTEEPE